MNAVASRVATAVYQATPRMLCFACLAKQQGLQEHDVRASALVLITRTRLQLVRHACSSCERVDELLGVPKAA